MAHDDPSLAELAALADSRDVRDRAFAASALRLQAPSTEPEQVAALYERVRACARREHATLRARIRAGALDKPAFLAELQGAPLELRDHLLEEILGIAYPPLGSWQLPPDAVPYSPSGLSEVLFALDNAELGPSKVFVDLGAGLGKVVLLAALLTGAKAYGVELDPRLVQGARAAASELRLHDAHFIEGDIRSAPLPAADVYYLFIPVLRSTEIAKRLMPRVDERGYLLFAPALDLKALPGLAARNRARYWLEMYECRKG